MFHRMERTTTEQIAATVRAELARRGIKRQDFAKALGWQRTTTWRRLRGESAFDVDHLHAIAEYLDVPVSTLLPDRSAA
jgi:transcriptional regulator with XRE-family HTH domain